MTHVAARQRVGRGAPDRRRLAGPRERRLSAGPGSSLRLTSSPGPSGASVADGAGRGRRPTKRRIPDGRRRDGAGEPGPHQSPALSSAPPSSASRPPPPPVDAPGSGPRHRPRPDGGFDARDPVGLALGVVAVAGVVLVLLLRSPRGTAASCGTRSGGRGRVLAIVAAVTSLLPALRRLVNMSSRPWPGRSPRSPPARSVLWWVLFVLPVINANLLPGDAGVRPRSAPCGWPEHADRRRPSRRRDNGAAAAARCRGSSSGSPPSADPLSLGLRWSSRQPGYQLGVRIFLVGAAIVLLVSPCLLGHPTGAGASPRRPRHRARRGRTSCCASAASSRRRSHRARRDRLPALVASPPPARPRLIPVVRARPRCRRAVRGSAAALEHAVAARPR